MDHRASSPRSNPGTLPADIRRHLIRAHLDWLDRIGRPYRTIDWLRAMFLAWTEGGV